MSPLLNKRVVDWCNAPVMGSGGKNWQNPKRYILIWPAQARPTEVSAFNLLLSRSSRLPHLEQSGDVAHVVDWTHSWTELPEVAALAA
jgi:hypothetical protein